MAFVLLEDLRRPMPKRARAVFRSFRLVRPLFTICRYTWRGSRFVIRQAVWVVLGDRPVQEGKPSKPARGEALH